MTEEELCKAYQEANSDPDQIEAYKDWECTMADGIEDE